MKYVFLHIEKTAGTSLVSYFEKEFGNDFIYIHPSELPKLKQSGVLDKKIMIAGHITMKDIYNYFPNRKIITFLRKPNDRVVSFYNFVKNNLETEDYITQISKTNQLSDFLKYCQQKNDRRFLNGIVHKLNSDLNIKNSLHSAMLNLNTIDYIGFQETFDEDLYELSEKYNFHKPKTIPKKNITPNKGSNKQLDDNTLKILSELNNEDNILYKKALELKPTKEGEVTK